MHEGIFTSESVTRGHPDKLCDQISDAVVDAFLAQDPLARVVAECAIATGVLFIAARFAAEASVDIPALARGVMIDAGYVDGAGFDARACSILTSFTDLGPGERGRTGRKDDEPAREQVNAFGYACRETPALMPLPIQLAHKLARALEAARRDAPFLAPDGKTQVAVQYADGNAARIHSITLTAATLDGVARSAALETAMRELVVAPAFRGEPLAPDAKTLVNVNPGGPYLVGGPAKHSGLTGRKTAIDTYGEYARQSGAALSGKDPSRIDRIGAYAARYAAKNIVAAGLAERCEVHLAYSIGLARPISVSVHTFGTGKADETRLAGALAETLDLRPSAIERRFALPERAAGGGKEGFFRRLAVYGQVGRLDLELPWEGTELADGLRT
jgi:S-adenosylmethionine synthetase